MERKGMSNKAQTTWVGSPAETDLLGSLQGTVHHSHQNTDTNNFGFYSKPQNIQYFFSVLSFISPKPQCQLHPATVLLNLCLFLPSSVVFAQPACGTMLQNRAKVDQVYAHIYNHVFIKT